MDIFASIDLTPALVRRLKDFADPDTVHFASSSQDGQSVHPAFSQCEIAFGNPPPEWFAAAPNLRWVQLESTGIDQYASLETTGKRQPVFTNLAGFFAKAAAETCLAGILALYRGMDACTNSKETKTWLGNALRSRLRTLTGKRVTMFGFGAINRRLAELLHPFDCEITAFRSDWKVENLDDALNNADIVVCAAPDTPGIRRVFDRTRLARMRDSALFVNVGRGSAVDEGALARLLAQGRIGGAVIDVTDDEPLASDHPLWDCPNLILTQHTAGGTDDELDRKLQAFADNLERYRSGEPLAGIVDFERGY